MGYFPVRYDSRVVFYERRGFIRLATDLVVMGWDLQSEGCGLESQYCILNGYFSHQFVVKCVLFCFKRLKISEKVVKDGPFLKIMLLSPVVDCIKSLVSIEGRHFYKCFQFILCLKCNNKNFRNLWIHRIWQ